MNTQTLTTRLALAQSGEQIQDATVNAHTVSTDNLKSITDEALANEPSLQVAGVLLWADGPVPDGVILPADADTKRLVLHEDKSPIGFASEAEAEEFLASEDGQKLVQFLGQQGATSVGIRAINPGGVPLWDMEMYGIEAGEQ